MKTLMLINLGLEGLTGLSTLRKFIEINNYLFKLNLIYSKFIFDRLGEIVNELLIIQRIIEVLIFYVGMCSGT